MQDRELYQQIPGLHSPWCFHHQFSSLTRLLERSGSGLVRLDRFRSRRLVAQCTVRTNRVRRWLAIACQVG